MRKGDTIWTQREATQSGVLKPQLVEEGDTVAVDEAVAVLEAE